jgi:hypothetical protein
VLAWPGAWADGVDPPLPSSPPNYLAQHVEFPLPSRFGLVQIPYSERKDPNALPKEVNWSTTNALLTQPSSAPAKWRTFRR